MDLTPEEKKALRPRFDWRIALPVVLSGLAHFMFAAVAEERKPDQVEEHAENMALMSKLLAVHADATEPTEQTEDKKDESEGAGTRAKGEEGAMGAPHIARMAALHEAAEFGMIGLSGTGEGGGGRGDGIGLGTIGTIGHGSGFGSGHGRLGGAHSVHAPTVRMGDGMIVLPGNREAQGPSGVRAGEWDDNASYREFKRVVASKSTIGFRDLDVSDRQFLVVRDVNGKPIPSCDVMIVGPHGTTTLRTLSTGRAILFPKAEGIGPSPWTASARCGGNAITKTFAAQDDGVVVLDGKEPRDAAPFTLDVGFALDTTGSMREEIVAVQSTIRKVASSLSEGVRVGLVEYKDRGDDIVTRVYPMASDINAFNIRVSGLQASGGGDLPEAMQSGLSDAVNKLEWRSTASARLLFVIADAPPHLDYQDEVDYRDSARRAAHLGIQIHAVSASGMDDRGQMIFRQIAQYTGGTELFVLRGGAGPQSTGGGDPLSSCGGTQTKYASGNLDALILEHIRAAKSAIDGNALDIRGLHTDWTAKPCQ